MQKLYHDLVSEKYQIGRSTRYIVSDPVIREIIVIPFRDRIVQHLVHSYIYPYFDRIFVYDNYANRKGK